MIPNGIPRRFDASPATNCPTRVILNALGVVDYGINNVVGALVAMFSLLSSSLSSSVSRFITFGLGKGNIEELKKIFR